MTDSASASGQSRPPALVRLLGLPRPDRRAALAELVGREFKRALLIPADGNLPFDDNYFELGLTSLKVSEVKERLETGLGCELETSVLFASSTVRQIVDHLADVVLADGIPGSAAHAAKLDRGADPVPEHRGLVDDLLRDLYGN
jgi:hypothetical protein